MSEGKKKVSKYNWRKFTELELMTANAYGEARLKEGSKGEDINEWMSIAHVVMNRAKHPRKWASNPKDVILQPLQFSWTMGQDSNSVKVWNFLETKSPAGDYQKMKIYMDKVLRGLSRDLTHGADHYVALWLYEGKNGWWRDMQVTTVFGGHIFLKEV